MEGSGSHVYSKEGVVRGARMGICAASCCLVREFGISQERCVTGLGACDYEAPDEMT